MKFRRTTNDLFTFVAFVALTLVMTWPWALHLRDGANDSADSYLNSWILWWDYHQTFHDPLNLFQANILYPYSYTLAFSEHNYGISLFFFPLYALGLRPLTVHGIAVLAGFALCGYGAFRLARTLTASNGAAWVAGVAFAFVPYRFHHLPHITYLFSGWIPLMLEALVLYVRLPNRKRAAWLGLAFFMNALTCIHWFVLTLIPLGLTVLLFASHHRLWRDRRFWIYGACALGLASIALLPFLVPYLRVKSLYGLQRGAEEAKFFSAHAISWLTVDWQNRLWKGLGSIGYQTELALFPGLVPLVLAVVALRFSWQRDASAGDDKMSGYRKGLIPLLDVLTLIAAVVILLSIGYRALHPWRALVPGVITLLARLLLTVPGFARRDRPLKFRLRRPSWFSEAIEIGLVWSLIGFIGSFGMNFVFHRTLFRYVPLFRSIRVPARWAMICFVGLSLLAAVGAGKLVERLFAKRSRVTKACAFALIIVALLFEQRSVPLSVIRGAADPDPVTLRLKGTPMNGGIVELPAGVENSNYIYTLRAADHARPLVNGISGFRPLIEEGIEEMSQSRPIPYRFLDLLEAIPVSYVVVHHKLMTPENDKAIRVFFDEGVAAGRLRLVERFGNDAAGDDLYVVTKTESNKLRE